MNMNKIFLILLFSILLQAQENKKIRLGLLYNNIYISEKKVILGFKIWEKQLKKCTKNKIEMFFYKNIEEIINDYSVGNKLDILLISPFIFFNNKDKLYPISKKFWTFQMGKYRLYEYYLLKHKSRKELKFDNLKGKIISYKAGDGSARFWLEKLSFENFLKPINKVAIIKNSKVSQTKVIYDLLFKKSDFAVVPKEVYDTLVELNTQIKTNLIILKKSPPIFSPVIGMFHKRLNDKIMKDLIDFIHNMNSSIKDEKVFSATILNKIVYITNKEFEFFDKFFKDYLIMKRKYKEGK